VSSAPQLPRPARLTSALVLAIVCLVAGGSCGGDEAIATGEPLFTDPFAIDMLVEQGKPGGPRSEGPNRLFGGWVPVTVTNRDGFLASAEGASVEIVTLVPRERTLTLDLLDDGRLSRLAQVRVRIDRGTAFSVPVIDPLAIRLPPDLPVGRHLVEIFPRTPGEPPLLVGGARLTPALEAGQARVEGTALVQTAPSAVDVVTLPPGITTDGDQEHRLTGSLCLLDRFAGGAGFAVEVVGTDGRVLAVWKGGAGVFGRLRACRSFSLSVATPGGASGEPLRVRFSAAKPGRTARWTVGWEAPRAHATVGATSTAVAEPAADPRIPPAPPRLVVVYLMDALRADFVGHLSGPEGISPVIDRLAREGFTFRAHRSNAPNTLPSMRELFTGRIYLDQAAWDRFGPGRPTPAEAFRRAGYRTGLFSGNQYVSATYGLARGFDHVSREALFDVKANRMVNRNAEQVHAAALDWLESVPPNQPVFLYLHAIHPHNPYAPPARFERRFTAGIPSDIRGSTETLVALEHGRREATTADRERLRGLYAGSLAYDDAELGKLLAALGERYAPEETLVILTSDHGEELFEHGGALHGYTLYEELLRIPLVVWAPGRIRTGETTRPTATLDLHATLVDLATRFAKDGSAVGGPTSEGRTLLPLLTGSAEAGDPGGRQSPTLAEPRYAATWAVPGGIYAVREGQWKLIEVDGTERGSWMGIGPGRSRERRYLFDLAADPSETENLAGLGSVREQWLLARLRAWVQAQREGAESGPQQNSSDASPTLDEETRERLRALGYLN